MKIDAFRTLPKLIRSILIATSLFTLLSCNDDQTPSDQTGSLSIQFSYRSAAGGFQPLTSKLDCDQTGVDEIEATVYDKNNEDIANGGPWKCKDGTGTIASVKAGSDRSVVIVGKDADGKIIFRGQRTGIKIFGDELNETGNIACDDFVPRLTTPEDGNIAKASDIHLKWAEVGGAKGYYIYVFNNEETSQPFLEMKTTEPEYVISESLSKLKRFYWQVVAFDDWQNESARSKKWSFVTKFSASTATGSEHTLAIREGKLWSWGSNTYGQLGLGDSGDNTERHQPTQVGSDTDWTHVAAGSNYSVAIKKNGTMWSWGCNDNKELGQDPKERMITSPTQIGDDSNWDYVAAGNYHVVAIKNSGELWAWGNNDHGQLGRGDKNELSQPTPMGNGGWVFVAAGDFHTLGIKANGHLWAWGQNHLGQLGISEKEDRLKPIPVGDANDWAFVTTSSSHTVAVKTNGELWAWGYNNEDQLSDDHTDNRDHRFQIGTKTDWIYAAASNGYSLAVNASGELLAWGANNSGQLGLGDTKGRSVPTGVGNEDWTFVSTNGDHVGGHVSAVTANDEIWCWGRNTLGEVGNGEVIKRTLPAKVGKYTDWKTIGQGYGNHASFVIKDNGELWAWGNKQKGQLGLGDVGHQQIPMKVGEDRDWTSVSNGGGFTVAIKEDGTCWKWGYDKNTPSEDCNDEGWVRVSAGDDFWLGIKKTGVDQKQTLWAWGSNSYGQLGLEDNENNFVEGQPVKVGEDTSWRTVAAGNNHAVALKNDGTLWTWGRNNYGQLGLGDKENDRNSPTRVGTDTDWKSVAAGTYFSLAIKEDGTLWTWGSNSNGQLGHGDAITPTRVETEDSVQWRQAAAGDSFTVAIKTDGTIWSWGNNKYGQLGYESSGSATYRSSPSKIGTDTDWVSVGASRRHALAIKKDGTLYSWGDNTYGQLGDDDNALQLTPVHVSFEQP